MTGADLKTARALTDWSQLQAARRLGVTQAYLSMLERGTRPVSAELAALALKVYPMPATARPWKHQVTGRRTEAFFKEAFGELGYPGFAYLKARSRLNPAELLLLALDMEDLDARVVEALPWLPFHFPDLDWKWLADQAKLRDRQNRLAFVTELARRVAEASANAPLAEALGEQVARLERSRLAVEDTLCKASLSNAERRWLRKHRPHDAAHWNLLTDLKREDLSHVYSQTSA